MICLWLWALDNAPDGDLTNLSPELIAFGAELSSDIEPSFFVDTLVSVGFLDRVEGILSIHDWYDYAGRLIERRKADADRKRIHRTSIGHPTDGRRKSAATVPYRTLPNHTNTIESSDCPQWFKTLSQDPRWRGERPAPYIKAIEEKYGGLNLDLEAHAAYEWLQTPKGQKKVVLRLFWT